MTTLYVSQTGDNVHGGGLNDPLRWYGEAVRRASSDPSITAIHFKRGERFGGGQINVDGLRGVRFGSYGDDEARPVVDGGIVVYSPDEVGGLWFEGLRIVNGGVSVIGPNDNKSDVVVLDVLTSGGSIGFNFSRVRGIDIGRCVAYVQHQQGALFGNCDGVRFADSVFIKNGWGPEGKRDTGREHGVYANDGTTSVGFDRCIFAHNGFYGWKAERGGTITNSLMLGHAIHIGLGPDGGGTNAIRDVFPSVSLHSEGNVYAAACIVPGGAERCYVTRVINAGQGPVSHIVDVVGAPVTSDGRVIDSPWRLSGNASSFDAASTRVFGYGVDSRTTYEPWEKLDTWEAIARVMLERGVSADEINASRNAAYNAITGDHPNVEPPIVVTPPEEPPVVVNDPPVDEPQPDLPSTDEPQTTPRVTLTAEGGGLYEVYVDGVLRSRHSQVREADESAINAAFEHPESEVYYLYPHSRVRVRVER